MSGINEWIANEVKSNDVVLFMKGTPSFPQCGFSGQVVQILDYLGVDYGMVRARYVRHARSIRHAHGYRPGRTLRCHGL